MRSYADQDDKQWVEVAPHADALIESLRGFGYSMETAIADLVDNSIAAGATSVDVLFYWDGPHSFVAITDDGAGMSTEDLTDAMRAGSVSPTASRAANDLGRYGLGLKTASFSQCRELTVFSRSGSGPTSVRRWNLDYVRTTSQWRLLLEPAEDAPAISLKSPGTVVVWTRMDRLVSESPTNHGGAQDRFLRSVSTVRDHLGVHFHRFIESGRLVLRTNGEVVKSWNPFLTSHPSTQRLPEERAELRGSQIRLRPFVLPHRSKLDLGQFEAAAGPRGWHAHQGFYVYRGDRLLVAGSWLRVSTRADEHSRLARIAIDVPSALDADWQIDVRKSVARPPAALAPTLARLASFARAQAAQVYRHRGKRVSRQPGRSVTSVWSETKKRDGTVAFRVNRDHPAVSQALQGHLDGDGETLLRLVEETVPTNLVALRVAEAIDERTAPFAEDLDELQTFLREVFDQMVAAGHTPRRAVDRLLVTEPFTHVPDLVEALTSTEEP